MRKHVRTQGKSRWQLVAWILKHRRRQPTSPLGGHWWAGGKQTPTMAPGNSRRRDPGQALGVWAAGGQQLGVGDGAGLWTEKHRLPACHFSGLALTPPPLASCPAILEASLARFSCPLDSSHSRLVDRAHGHSPGGQCGKCPLQDGETEAQSAPHPHICRLLPLPAPLQLLTRPRPLC